MNETYESPLNTPRKFVETMNDAVVITVTVVSIVALLDWTKDVVTEASARHRHKKANKK